ncbi:MAG: glycerophosphodiester phosphodiesterase family protein, partial [Candidatus Dormibacteria bacterium]
VEPLMQLLQRLRAVRRVCLASFSDRRVRRMRQIASGGVRTSMGRWAVTLAYACSRSGRMPGLNAGRAQVPLRAGPLTVVDRRFVDAAHRAGVAVDVWTVNTDGDMHHAVDLGVDGIMSDRLQLLKTVLTSRGRWENAG